MNFRKFEINKFPKANGYNDPNSIDNNPDIRIARINTTKKRLQNILQNKIKSTIDIEPSKIQKELVINDSLTKSKLQNSNINNDSKKIIPKMLKKVIILLIIKIK